MTALTPGVRIKVVGVDGKLGRVVRIERKTTVEPRWNRSPAMVVVDFDDGQRQLVLAHRVRIVE